jgi:H+-transporting ATPase
MLPFAHLPELGLSPLPAWQTLAILTYAMISCLVANDTLKVAMIRWRASGHRLKCARALIS